MGPRGPKFFVPFPAGSHWPGNTPPGLRERGQGDPLPYLHMSSITPIKPGWPPDVMNWRAAKVDYREVIGQYESLSELGPKEIRWNTSLSGVIHPPSSPAVLNSGSNSWPYSDFEIGEIQQDLPRNGEH